MMSRTFFFPAFFGRGGGNVSVKKTEESVKMRKNKEKVYLSMALVLLMTVSIFFYALYIRQQIYYEGTRAMLETYEQVNKTFTMFAQRNWNVLADWGGYLREMAAPETATQWKDFGEEKKTWNYSDFYMANENGDYWTVDGREGLGSENIQAVFTALQVAGEPIVSSYTATSGVRKVVFAVPVEPITMSGVTYTSLAVSYDNDTIEEMIGGRAYGGRSDCYIIHPNGDIMLSEEPKSEITAWMENLFDYLETNTEVNETCLREMQEQTLQGGSGSVPYRFKGRNYYLVYQPVGFQDLTIVGIVERNVVDAGMRKVQCVTIFLLAFLALAVVAALVRSIKMDLRFVLAEQEEAFHRESTERQKMEDLANTDGLTCLSNERFFNATLQKKEKAGEPFALFYLDLDSFKPVNDTYGHDVGDQLLKAVACRLRTCVRSTDYAFRIGGDEFALIVNGALSEEFCAKRTERIKDVLTQPFVINGQELHIGTSCGSALYPADSTEVKDIRILADQRMYEDKAHKPGRQGR